MWFIFALLSAVFAALVAIFGKLGLSKIDTTLATTIRSIIMAAFLVAVSLALGKFEHWQWNALNGRQWTFIILAGIAGAMSWLFYFGALRIGDAPKVAAVDRLSVAIVLIAAIIFLHEPAKVKSILGAIIMVIGAMLMVL
jgi:bacterial/archaeal transporter family protein